MTLEGLDRLVGRDLHEAPRCPTAAAASTTLSVPSTLVVGRLERVLLQDGDVLVGGGVEHHLGPVALERLEHRRAVGDVHQHLLARARTAWPRRRAGGSRRGRAGPAGPGRSSATWRQISEPIEPPAPVTSTRRPVERAADGLEVGRHRASGPAGPRCAARGPGGGPPGGCRLVEHVLDAGEDLHRHAGRLRGPQGAVDELGGGVGDGQQHLLDGVAAGRRRGSPRCRRPRGRPSATGRGPGRRRRTPPRGRARRRGCAASRGWPRHRRHGCRSPPPAGPPACEPRCQANSREWNRRTPMPTVTNMQPTTTTIERYQLQVEELAHRASTATRTVRVVATDRRIWRASSIPAWRHMRPYRPNTRLALEVTTTATARNAMKWPPVAARRPVAEVGDLGEPVADDHGHGVQDDEEDGGPHAAGRHGDPTHVGPCELVVLGLPRVGTHVSS